MREYKKIICKTKLEDLVHNLKVSPSFIESYEKIGYLFDRLLKNSFGYWLFIERNFINDAIFLVNNKQEGLCLSVLLGIFG